MLEAYNGGVLSGNILGAIMDEITLLGLNAEIANDVEKVQMSARGEYLATTFLLISDRRRYGELVL